MGDIVPFTELKFLMDASYNKMADFIGLNQEQRADLKLAERIDFLAEWAKRKSKSESTVDWLVALKGLQEKLGTHERGETLLKALYQYTRLAAQRAEVEKEMGLYEEKKPEPEVEGELEENFSTSEQEEKEEGNGDYSQ